jgi:hypothetical protein
MGDDMKAHEVYIEKNGREVGPVKEHKELQPRWQDPAFEYENRLEEYIRLQQRGVDDSVLEEHAKGVRAARKTYQDAVVGDRHSMQSSKMKNRRSWSEDNTKVKELEAEYNQLRDGKREP